MNAIIVSVTINDAEKATETLRNEIVPQVSQAPGFVAGYWVSLDNRSQGRGTIVFESEEAASAVADQIHQMAGDEVTLDNVQVGQVEARA
jgi:hypothetical protein